MSCGSPGISAGAVLRAREATVRPRRVVGMASGLGLGKEQHAVVAGVWHMHGGRPLSLG